MRSRWSAAPPPAAWRCGAELVRLEVIDVDQVHDLAVVVAQRRGLGLRDQPGRERLLDLPGQIERRDLAGLHALDADALLDRLELDREQQRLLQQAERIAGLERPVDVVAQPLARLGGRGHQPRHLAPEPVVGREVDAAAREDQHAHHRRQHAVRKIAQEAVQLLLRLVEQFPARPLDDRQVLVAGCPWFSWCLSTIEARYMRGQHVAEARREALLLLQVAAEGQHGDVDGEGERGAEALDVLVVARGRAGDRARA